MLCLDSSCKCRLQLQGLTAGGESAKENCLKGVGICCLPRSCQLDCDFIRYHGKSKIAYNKMKSLRYRRVQVGTFQDALVTLFAVWFQIKSLWLYTSLPILSFYSAKHLTGRPQDTRKLCSAGVVYCCCDYCPVNSISMCSFNDWKKSWHCALDHAGSFGGMCIGTHDSS